MVPLIFWIVFTVCPASDVSTHELFYDQAIAQAEIEKAAEGCSYTMYEARPVKTAEETQPAPEEPAAQ